jgi:hypothetical protein
MRRGAAATLGYWLILLVAVIHGLAGQQTRAGAAPSRQMTPVIFTAAPEYAPLAALRGGERFPRGAQLMVLRDGHNEPLTPGFVASADPSVSFDGKTLLFTGKKSAGDPWGIWEVALDGGTPRRVMPGSSDLIRPMWMPDGRMVYARRTADGFALETVGLDGQDVLRLTYLAGNFIPDDVLRDGRVLFESGFPLGAGATPELFLVYADGSGVESVRCDHPEPSSAGREHGRQLLSGDVVFTHGKKLGRFTSALAAEAAIAAPAGEYAGDVAELPAGQWLLTVRKPGEKHFVLVAWKLGATATEMLARDPEQDLVEPVMVAPRAIPNRHPSALHDWEYGNLLALDARQSRSEALGGVPAAVRAETLGAEGRVIALGTAPVEKDGSFFVQAMGDRPLRFILLDAAGKTLREEQGWFWVRRGEQRICVGCHTGPERAPKNRVPQVLLRTTTPVDLTGGAAAGRAAAGGH